MLQHQQQRAALPLAQLLVEILLTVLDLAPSGDDVADALAGPGLALRQRPLLHDLMALRRVESCVVGRAQVPSDLTAGLLLGGALITIVSTVTNDLLLPRGLESRVKGYVVRSGGG